MSSPLMTSEINTSTTIFQDLIYTNSISTEADLERNEQGECQWTAQARLRKL